MKNLYCKRSLGYTSEENPKLAFEVQELADVIKILIMLNLKDGLKSGCKLAIRIAL